MKKTNGILLLVAVTALFFASCRTASNLNWFRKCHFDLVGIKDIRIADIDISKIKSFDDFSLKDAAKIGVCLLEKKVPLNLTFMVNIANGTNKIGVLQGMDYIVVMHDKDVLYGKITEPIAVAPNSSQVYNVKSELELISLFNKEDLKENVILGLKVFAADNIYNDIAIKVRPYLKQGKPLRTGFITIKHAAK